MVLLILPLPQRVFFPSTPQVTREVFYSRNETFTKDCCWSSDEPIFSVQFGPFKHVHLYFKCQKVFVVHKFIWTNQTFLDKVPVKLNKMQIFRLLWYDTHCFILASLPNNQLKYGKCVVVAMEIRWHPPRCLFFCFFCWNCLTRSFGNVFIFSFVVLLHPRSQWLKETCLCHIIFILHWNRKPWINNFIISLCLYYKFFLFLQDAKCVPDKIFWSYEQKCYLKSNHLFQFTSLEM